MSSESDLQILGEIEKLLSQLQDKRVVMRIIRWIIAKYELEPLFNRILPIFDARSKVPENLDIRKYKDLGVIFSLVQPKTDSERVLLGGYFLQVVEGNVPLKAKMIKQILIQMGYEVSNITAALRGLIRRKPQLVRVVSKASDVQQSHKQYQLTLAGTEWVESRFNKGGNYSDHEMNS